MLSPTSAVSIMLRACRLGHHLDGFVESGSDERLFFERRQFAIYDPMGCPNCGFPVKLLAEVGTGKEVAQKDARWP